MVRVLIVEDELQLRRIVARNLRERGYETDEASTAAYALTLCAAHAPDVLVLDMNLPDATGWDVLRGLDAQHVPRPAVVAMSAVSPTRGRLAQFHPLVFLQKPFPIEALLRAVERALTEERDDQTVDSPAI